MDPSISAMQPKEQDMPIFITFPVKDEGSLKYLSKVMDVTYDPCPGPYVQFYRNGKVVGFVARAAENGLVVMTELEKYHGLPVIDTRKDDFRHQHFLSLGKNPSFNFRDSKTGKIYPTIRPHVTTIMVNFKGFLEKVCPLGFIIQIQEDPPRYARVSDFSQRHELTIVSANAA